MAAEHNTLFRPGRNCHRVALARRAALLVDGEAYFRAFAHSALHAEHSIVIVGWDFHSQTRLHHGIPGVPDLLGEFLNELVRRKPRLRIFILIWDCPRVFAKGREQPATSEDGWQAHPRITLHYDGNCRLNAALHQKLVVIDGAVGFCGGMDLTLGRWDTPAHAWADPQRTNIDAAEPYAPVHDTMLVVDSGAALALHGVATERWWKATGSTLPMAYTATDPWPDTIVPTLLAVNVAVARTVAAGADSEPITEVETSYLDMIAAAKKYIYIENQYFSARTLGEALAARLAEPNGPEIVAVLRLSSSGWLEEPTMTALRSDLLQKLREADSHGRFSAWYPDTPGEPGCDVHSKLVIVDDEWLRVGSANFANRSLGLDAECDLIIEAGADAAKQAAIAAARNGLLAEHLDLTPHDVKNALLSRGSLQAAIAAFAGKSGRTLRPFARLDEPSSAMLALASEVADPEERHVSCD
jgi:phospholipase D1/2